jgi:hypothetical protein
MSYSKAKMKISGDKASPCYRLFWIGKLSGKYLATRTSPYVSFKHILISLTSFMESRHYRCSIESGWNEKAICFIVIVSRFKLRDGQLR